MLPPSGKMPPAALLDSLETPLFRAVAGAIGSEMYIAAPDYRLVYMNPRMTARIGLDRVGKTCHEILHGRRSPCPFCVMEQVLAGETVRFDIRNPRDGRWHQSVDTPVMPGREAPFLLSMITDIHDRKMAEAMAREGASCLLPEKILERAGIGQRHKFGNLVGASAAMQKVYEEILNAAASDANVIIYGEPGTGKELVAHAIHDLSDRRRHRFVPVHCGAIPESLFESEFFGYVRGAFSGAIADREGYIAYADRGTLFLDEVGEINLHMQVKLLRVIEGGGYTPVGGNQVARTDIRIIGATNRDLTEKVRAKRFREDFYFRVHILPIYLPPLRDRKEDLPLLVAHFLLMHGGKQNLPPLTDRMMDRLYDHDWPGNVRELQSVIIRYCAMKGIDLALSDPAPSRRGPDPADISETQPLKDQVERYEKRIITSALARHRWHRSHVAQLLGVDRKTLFTKMKRYGLLDRHPRRKRAGRFRPK